MQGVNSRYSVNLSFEEIKLPPFEDILILGSKCPHGKVGVAKSFEFLIPDEFEICEVEDENIEAVFINKHILKKIGKEIILDILKEKVFPYLSDDEMLRVDFKLKINFDSIEGELECALKSL